MSTSGNIPPTNSARGRALRAAALDVQVKKDLAATYARDSAKIARLKALRLAKLAADDTTA
jgi:hypothetical protein